MFPVDFSLGLGNQAVGTIFRGLSPLDFLDVEKLDGLNLGKLFAHKPQFVIRKTLNYVRVDYVQ